MRYVGLVNVQHYTAVWCVHIKWWCWDSNLYVNPHLFLHHYIVSGGKRGTRKLEVTGNIHKESGM